MIFSLRLLALALASTLAAAHAETISGEVVAIAEGDLLTLVDGARRTHEIRLAAIDSPGKTQDFGSQARLSLSALALNQQASADCRRIDRQRRAVCVVVVGGRDLGLEQIRSGLAWWYRDGTAAQTASERAAYEGAEFFARIYRAGLWNSKNPTPPWNWPDGSQRPY